MPYPQQQPSGLGGLIGGLIQMKAMGNEKAAQEALQRKQYELELKKSGMIELPGGGFDYAPDIKQKKESEKKAQDLEIQSKNLGIKKTQSELSDKEFEKTPQGRLAKAPGEAQKSVQFVTNALRGLTDYENQFRSGGRERIVNTETPVIGGFLPASEIDVSRSRLMNAISRLESGANMPESEVRRFLSMLPKGVDSPEIQIKKLAATREEMMNALRARGFNPEDLGQAGFDTKSLGIGDEYANQPMRGLMPGSSGLINSSPTTPAAQQAKPKQVKQNGHIYNLNEQTGEYE